MVRIHYCFSAHSPNKHDHHCMEGISKGVSRSELSFSRRVTRHESNSRGSYGHRDLSNRNMGGFSDLYLSFLFFFPCNSRSTRLHTLSGLNTQYQKAGKTK